MNCRTKHYQASLRSGFSLVEVMIATCVLTIGLLALSSTSVVIHSLDRADEARRLANMGMQDVVERVKALSSQASQDPTTWSNTVSAGLRAGGQIGPAFQIQGLDPWAGNLTVGTVQVITDETTTDAALGITLGLPRDLNGDGDASDTDVTTDAALLPVVVRTRWGGSAGNREALQAFYLTDM